MNILPRLLSLYVVSVVLLVVYHSRISYKRWYTDLPCVLPGYRCRWIQVLSSLSVFHGGRRRYQVPFFLDVRPVVPRVTDVGKNRTEVGRLSKFRTRSSSLRVWWRLDLRLVDGCEYEPGLVCSHGRNDGWSGSLVLRQTTGVLPRVRRSPSFSTASTVQSRDRVRSRKGGT